MAKKRGNTFFTTVLQEVEVDVDLSIDEVIGFLENEGYAVVQTGSESLSRDSVKKMLERVREEFGGTLAEIDYWHGTELKIPPGATVLIVPGL